MTETTEPKFYLKLNIEQRLQLVAEIMESVLAAAGPESVRGPTWDDLERRLAGPDRALSWQEFCRQLGWSE
ncbi:MAG: hypothetical protein M5U25_03035 [Planctomycetota bacterium]|nr:hypothetical protein [Planctomycetota bacterium]